MDFMQLFQILMTAATTVIVAIIGAHSAKKEARDKETRDLEAKLRAEREKAAKEVEAKRDKQLSGISHNVESLKKEVSEVKENQKTMDERLERVADLTEYNLKFSTAINEALITLSEQIIDDQSDEVLRKTLQTHRSKTNSLNEKLYNITF